ncbi:type I-C CRISPR-associated protein Cas8c/Csd1 [Candidatus Magnetominusculus xianensis]|uniref:Type I-C CRISPR-associated protein Cas8c/Csd1 n=1 Tax=Candidatus Magnetominusculus xianensis TaxID=1748249 RepID=A0ABR5SDV0_9BACT|nr:type I-C CRISPR-associated protein Cas8c/Csd1 [Candidatus Magnetominusculus xianensis]KWT83495.1 type I-C CRISPR-associated protein Cas8c/Csd1 [Candidatus Magnetominusculus xianensis]MBF0404135.1 type I-C CRISPR-associated protein Cas8c/Csd1 [Nitrospirota bacterium]
MSWTQKLYDTYENCSALIGKIPEDDTVPLLPIGHTTQMAQIEIVIDDRGNFKQARIVKKDDARTIIPCTESSGGRTSGESPHPLSDKLQYVANDYKDYGGDKKPYSKSYINNLEAWCASNYCHEKAKAVLEYVNKGTVIEDLINHGILHCVKDGKLLHIWEGDVKDKPEIFFLIKGNSSQSDAFIRWEVEHHGNPCSKTWQDDTLRDSWIKYYSSTKQNKALCYIKGDELLSADMHPAKIRNDGDSAKLISSNDKYGFTFRGRFTDEFGHQVCGVSFEATQMIHNALRWLIGRQGYRNGDQTIVAWATSGKDVPNPVADMPDDLPSDDPAASVSTAQEFAVKLRDKIRGYKKDLGDTSSIVIMGLDSASPGRMAITFYRELTGSEFIDRLDSWHETCTWVHEYGIKEKKKLIFEGAPAPKDIAIAAYGINVDDKLTKATVERLLPCIIDGRQVPLDIVVSAVRRACNPLSMETWQWNKTLSIACALYKKFYEKEKYDMALDESRKTRDYLYGRLLAAADSLENVALSLTGEKRETNAVRLMQRFSDHPYTTWKTIEFSLLPYRMRLVRANKYLAVIDKVMTMFEPSENFINDKPLSGEFLLGYHCQREVLKRKKGQAEGGEDINTEDEG